MTFLKWLATNFLEANGTCHIVCAALIRAIFVVYGEFHDRHFEVPYTDVDYKVFTDASRYVLNGESPYKRHTFRYSPIIALLLTPNIWLHPVIGKVIFCCVDIVVALLIYRLVSLNVADWMSRYESYALKKTPGNAKGKKTKKIIKNSQSKEDFKKKTQHFWAQRAMLCWLWNPMTLAISTRGNSDSLACFLIISTLIFIQTEKSPFLVGLLHGFSIHFRLYPIIYSLIFYMYYSRGAYYFEQPVNEEVSVHKQISKRKDVHKPKKLFSMTFWANFVPNFNQLKLVAGTLTSLLTFTGIFYYKYGRKFLNETIFYHFTRVDFRHNFSLYFYLQYLTAFLKMPTWSEEDLEVSIWYLCQLWQPLLVSLPPMVLLATFSIYYGLNKFSLNFGVLVLTIVFVVYNKVITSQYFVWVLGILPLCIWQLNLTKLSVIIMLFLWFAAQGAWLLPAYHLEFRGENMFFQIWIQGVSLFCAHLGILGRLIKNFTMPFGAVNGYTVGRDLLKVKAEKER